MIYLELAWGSLGLHVALVYAVIICMEYSQGNWSVCFTVSEFFFRKFYSTVKRL